MLRLLKRRVLHRLAQVTLCPEDGQRLRERLESGASLRAEERDPLMAVVRAMQACQQLLAQAIAAALPASKWHAKRKGQEAKAVCRRSRR